MTGVWGNGNFITLLFSFFLISFCIFDLLNKKKNGEGVLWIL